MSQTKAQLLAPIGIITCPGLDVTVGGSTPFQVGATGIITAVSASFSGDVAVGGTLTYEDVTNIDSVGLITARKGINVTAGVSTFAANIDANANINANGNIIGDNSTNISGIASVTATSLYGDGSGISNLPASGGVVSGVATGSIAIGKPVVLTTAGQFAQVTGTTDLFGTPGAFANNANGDGSICYDTLNDQYLIAYSRNTAIAYARTGSLSGTTITWGSEHVVNSSGSIDKVRAVWDDYDNKLLVIYVRTTASNQGFMTVVDVNGTTFTNGTEANYSNGGKGTRNCLLHVPGTSKVVVLMEDDNNYTRSSVGTITAGTNAVSFGTHQLIDTARSFDKSMCWHSGESKVVVAYQDYSNGEWGTVLAGEVSGTSMTWGTEQAFNTTKTNSTAVVYDSGKNTIIIGWTEGEGSYYPKVTAATLSGTTFSFGNTLDLKGLANNQAQGESMTAQYDPTSGKTLLFWWTSATSPSTLVSSMITLTGSTLSQTDVHTVNQSNFATNLYPNSCFNPDDNLIAINYRDETGTTEGEYYIQRIGQTNVNSTNFLGYSQGGYTDGQTAKVDVIGAVNTSQSGLTTASEYFVHKNGTISVTDDGNNIKGGLAMSGTEILIR